MNLKIGKLSLLGELFDELILPEAVYRELAQIHQHIRKKLMKSKIVYEKDILRFIVSKILRWLRVCMENSIMANWK